MNYDAWKTKLRRWADMVDVRDGWRLEGEGFVIRRWRAEDARGLIRNANDAEIARGLGNQFPYPYRRMDAWRFLAGEVVDLSEPTFAIEMEGHACGGIGAHLLKGERSGSAELGYWLGRRYWGQGVMTRVLAIWVPWLMAEHDLHRVQASVFASNPASARVLEKSGFVQEGVLRSAVRKQDELHDLTVFARLRAE